MKNAIYIFLSLVLVFFVNLLLYIYSADYRELIQWIKNNWSNIQTEWITDVYSLSTLSGNTLILPDTSNSDENVVVQNELVFTWTLTSTWVSIWNTQKEEKEKEEVEKPISQNPWVDDIWRVANLWEKQKDLLDLFSEMNYWLYLKNQKDDLLDIAWEYPDEYLQYWRDWVDVYMLTTRQYSEVLEIFEALEFDMPFSINITNSFWEQSFFINLNSDDQKIRMIVQTASKVYGFKIKQENYEKVKQILLQL